MRSEARWSRSPKRPSRSTSPPSCLKMVGVGVRNIKGKLMLVAVHVDSDDDDKPSQPAETIAQDLETGVHSWLRNARGFVFTRNGCASCRSLWPTSTTATRNSQFESCCWAGRDCSCFGFVPIFQLRPVAGYDFVKSSVCKRDLECSCTLSAS